MVQFWKKNVTQKILFKMVVSPLGMSELRKVVRYEILECQGVVTKSTPVCPLIYSLKQVNDEIFQKSSVAV